MQRFALIVLAALATAAPAISSHSPAGLLNRAQNQVAALDIELDQVRNPHLRNQLEDRVARLDRILNRLEATGAVHGGGQDFRGDFRNDGFGRAPHPRPHHRPAFATFQDAMFMVQQERFERDKLAVIQSQATRMRLTSDEARTLVQQLNFDNNRAEALIALYPSIVDKHRFRVAMGALDFTSNRRRVAHTLGV